MISLIYIYANKTTPFKILKSIHMIFSVWHICGQHIFPLILISLQMYHYNKITLLPLITRRMNTRYCERTVFGKDGHGQKPKYTH